MPTVQFVILSQHADCSKTLFELLPESFQLINCDSYEQAMVLCLEKDSHFLLADFRGPLAGGHLEDCLLDELQKKTPNLTIFMATDEDCPETLERRAACSDIVHFRNSIEFGNIVETCTARFSQESENVPIVEPVQEVPAKTKKQSNSQIVLGGITRQFETRTPLLKKMLCDLEVAAKHDVTTLLIGETGSGKTFLSKLIHEVSPRRNEPFINVACGALPRELIESEMFGHMKGSFTSAHTDKEGKFLAAGRGTILLDEIDVLGPEQQVKLLKVIETGEFEPVGSNKTIVSQARLVVASNMNLQPLVEQGKFRPDLYYRLNMLKFEIPPLRDRKPDIIPMAKKFVNEMSSKHNIVVENIEEDLLGALMAYPWPGNVRELENVIQRAVIYCQDGILKSENLPQNILVGDVGPSNDPTVMLSSKRESGAASLGQQVALTEREIIEQVLCKNNHSRTNTAKELGISRVTLYNKMKKYDMSK